MLNDACLRLHGVQTVRGKPINVAMIEMSVSVRKSGAHTRTERL
jgi:hypothetical protein